MSFFSKIFGGASRTEQPEEPVRNRTFSATQFRDEELARAAESRARVEAARSNAAEVLSPAINPVAETLMANEPENAEHEPEGADLVPEAAAEPVEAAADPVEPAAAAVPATPAAAPMAWDEAVGWLSQRSAESRNFVGTYWNWDHDLRVLHFLAQQPDLDAGVAAHIFWLTAASEDHFPFGDDEPASEVDRQVAWLTDFLGRRFAEGAFRPARYGFDDSWDCERLKEHLSNLHADGRLGWSPEAIPTSSQGELMSFDDIPEEERQDVAEFLARFGVC
jgi:hypothetical protein